MFGDTIPARRSLGLLRSADNTSEPTHSDSADSHLKLEGRDH